jgi:hypothetical protein
MGKKIFVKHKGPLSVIAEITGSEVSRRLDIDHVDYSYREHDGFYRENEVLINSEGEGSFVIVSEDFRPEGTCFDTVDDCLGWGKKESFETWREWLASTGVEDASIQSIFGQTIVDSVIANPDRHGENWGYIVREEDNKILRPAPAFDFGEGLWLEELSKNGEIKPIDSSNPWSGLFLVEYDFPTVIKKLHEIGGNPHFWDKSKLKDVPDFVAAEIDNIGAERVFSKFNKPIDIRDRMLYGVKKRIEHTNDIVRSL